MPKSKKKQSRKAASRRTTDALDPLRPGMPAQDSIREVVDFVSPKKKDVHYKILKTTEMDAYDPIPKPKKGRGSKL